jgi:acetyl esterase/lipase
MRLTAILAIWALCCEIPVLTLAAEDAPRILRDIPYSDAGGVRTCLDVYAPAGGDKLPIMIWIHGGGWRFGNKNNVLIKPAAFNAQGFVFVSTNYRLQLGVTYQDQAGDVGKAIGWVHAHAAEFGGDPAKIYLMGHSAGAHLAALVSTDQRYLKAAGMKLADVAGVVLLDGAAYDIPRQIEIAPLPRMKAIYTDAFGDNPADQRDASPITHVAAGKGIPPFLILYVANRRDGKLQSTQLSEALTRAGVASKLFAAENKTHATISGDFGQTGDAPTEAVFAFLKERQAGLKK